MKEVRKRSKSKKNNKKKIFLIVFLLLLIFIAFNALMILRGLNEYHKGTDTYADIQGLVIRKEEPGGRIDFDQLRSINKDVVGWLTLKDTVIDYPVVKGEDNDYYLHHLYTGEWNSLGTLFVDFRNRDLFKDQISAIYGHSMLNGSMFFILERYKNQSFYEEHTEFVFETPDRTYILEPYAGKVMNAAVPFLQFNFNSEQEYYEYICEFIETSTFMADFTPSQTDKTVMMIKCSADFEDARYVLLCRVRESQSLD